MMTINPLDFLSYDSQPWAMAEDTYDPTQPPSLVISPLKSTLLDLLNSSRDLILNAYDDLLLSGYTTSEACAYLLPIAEGSLFDNATSQIEAINLIEAGQPVTPPSDGEWVGWPIAGVAVLYDVFSSPEPYPADSLILGTDLQAAYISNLGGEPVDYTPVPMLMGGDAGAGEVDLFRISNPRLTNIDGAVIEGIRVVGNIKRGHSLKRAPFVEYVMPSQCGGGGGISRPPRTGFIIFSQNERDAVESQSTQPPQQTTLWFANHARLLPAFKGL